MLQQMWTGIFQETGMKLDYFMSAGLLFSFRSWEWEVKLENGDTDQERSFTSYPYSGTKFQDFLNIRREQGFLLKCLMMALILHI